MDPQIRARWVAALRSGKYEQTAGSLHDECGFCCLGVLCELAVQAGIMPAATLTPLGWKYGALGEGSVLPLEVRQWAGIGIDPCVTVDLGEGREITSLSGLNDECEWSFGRIADLIEGVAA
jgi:hypothetical protein